MGHFANLDYADGQFNPGGTATKHYWGLQADVDTWPEVDASPAASADYVTLVGDLVMKSGKQCFEFYTTLDTGKVEDKAVGEFDGKSYESTFEGLYPGSSKTAAGITSQMLNSNVFVIAVEADGKMRLLGNAIRPAKVMNDDWTTGAKLADRRGATIKIVSGQGTKCPYYEGDIDSLLTPAS